MTPHIKDFFNVPSRFLFASVAARIQRGKQHLLAHAYTTHRQLELSPLVQTLGVHTYQAPTLRAVMFRAIRHPFNWSDVKFSLDGISEKVRKILTFQSLHHVTIEGIVQFERHSFHSNKKRYSCWYGFVKHFQKIFFASREVTIFGP